MSSPTLRIAIRALTLLLPKQHFPHHREAVALLVVALRARVLAERRRWSRPAVTAEFQRMKEELIAMELDRDAWRSQAEAMRPGPELEARLADDHSFLWGELRRAEQRLRQLEAAAQRRGPEACGEVARG